jgi:hypothetical protein
VRVTNVPQLSQLSPDAIVVHQHGNHYVNSGGRQTLKARDENDLIGDKINVVHSHIYAFRARTYAKLYEQCEPVELAEEKLIET